MIVAMQESATEDQIQGVIDHLVTLGFEVHRSTGARQTVLGRWARARTWMSETLNCCPVSGGTPDQFALQVGWAIVPSGGDGRPLPERIGDRRQGSDRHGRALLSGIARTDLPVAEQVADAGAQVLRGGAFKPRSSPYSFQGMGEEGLKLMREAADRAGLLGDQRGHGDFADFHDDSLRGHSPGGRP